MAAALARGDLAAAVACLGNVFERVLTEEEGEEKPCCDTVLWARP